MKNEPQKKSAANPVGKPGAVKVFCVGNAGLNVAEQIIRSCPAGVTLVGVNTDAESLAASTMTEKIVMETRIMRGLGTGGDPERGRAAANEHLGKLKEACLGAKVVFVVAGLGGGAGSGISPVLARAAKDTGALVLAFVTLPFDCEGNRRGQIAEHGLQELKSAADGVICLPNQKLFRMIDENTSVLDTFKRSNELLAEGLINVWRLVAHKGLIEIHFADLCALLRDRHGESALASAEAMGATRSREVMDRLLAHPMLDEGELLTEADTVLISLIGGPDLAMSEVNRVMKQINDQCAKAQVIMGAAIEEQFRERLAVTVVASRRAELLLARAGIDEAAHGDAAPAEPPRLAENLQLLNRTSPPRPQSRFVPPPPPLSLEKMEQLMKQPPGPRTRKTPPKMRQGQLPLEIVSKGRFDKSEPTIHKGEDLDVPTYIRRGVSLN
jgi:cell division protein FtsZ